MSRPNSAAVRAFNAYRPVIPTAPYQPECLTLYLENRCNLRCSYCYSDPQNTPTGTYGQVSLAAVRGAAERVARNCRAKNKPLTLVMHGGGEPSLDWAGLVAALDVVKAVAAQSNLQTFGYIASNGVMPPERARQMAGLFDLVGLSCDGPEEIQRRQRPLANGESSAPALERTASILRAAGTPFHARVTITPSSVQRQEEIVAYLIERLGPAEIHIEPVYRGGRSTEDGGDAQAFVEHFLAARDLAAQSGVRVAFSGTRPGELHGPFCQVHRQVLQLVPGDAASPCFKLSDAGQLDRLDARVGELRPEGFWIDEEKVRGLQAKLAWPAVACPDCFNGLHCAGSCPDQCALESQTRPGAGCGTFRCRVQMRLAAEAIERAAAAAPPSSENPVALISLKEANH